MGQLRKIRELLGLAAVASQKAQHLANGDKRAAHAGLAEANGGIDSDAVEVCNGHSISPS